MKPVNGLKTYTHTEVKDRCLGKPGTKTRDKFEISLKKIKKKGK